MYLWRRISALLVHPVAEWRTIAAEPDEIAAICQSYVSALALIPCVSLFGGLWFAGGRYLGAVALLTATTGCMVNWVVSLGGPLAAATIIDKLSPLFDADGGATASYKLVAYAGTPFWVAGIFYASASLERFVVLGAVWTGVLVYVGAPIVMKVPPARTATFTVAALVVIVAVHAALRSVFAAFSVPYMGY